jgi:hypothetical protein
MKNPTVYCERDCLYAGNSQCQAQGITISELGCEDYKSKETLKEMEGIFDGE